MCTLLRNTVFVAVVATLFSTNSHARTQIVTVSNNVFTPQTFAICQGDTVKWIWSNGVHTTTSQTIPTGATAWNNPIDGSNTSFTYVPSTTLSGTYNYWCAIHTTSMVGSFTVNAPLATPSIVAAGSTSICAGSNVTLALTTLTVPGSIYQWYLGTATVPGANSTSYAASIAGSYTLKDSIGGCPMLTSNPLVVTVNPAPAIPTLSSTHQAATYTFTSDAPTALNYVWDFGDGTTQSNLQAPLPHTYTTAGAKIVSLKVTNASTCSATGLLTINVSLGIANIGSKHSITIAPNPASETLTIHTDGAKTSAVLIDATGRIVNNAPQSTSGNNILIDVHKLAAGMYMLRLAIDGATATEKIRIER